MKKLPILLLTLFLFSCVRSKPLPEPVPQPPKNVSPKLPNNDWK